MAGDLDELQALWLDLRAHIDRLADEREHYLEFFEQAPAAYLVTDLEGVIEDLNGAAVDIVQRRRRDARGKPLAELVALDHRPEFRRRLRALVAREALAPTPWRTVFVAAGERIEVALCARVIVRREGAGGACWRLETP